MKKSNDHPQWEDLDPFILSHIFAHLSLHDQLFGPPYVCFSWLSASLHTLFNHPNLDLSSIQHLDQDQEQEQEQEQDHQLHQKQLSRYTHLLKLAIKHCKNWVSISFPSKHMLDFSTTMFIAENTPNMSQVVLPCDASVDAYPVFMSLMYWRNLQAFHAPMRPPDKGFQFVQQLVDYCKNIVELGVHGDFTEKEVSCLVEGFPGLRVLDFSESTLSVNALGVLLDGRLKCIKELNMLHCVFLDEVGIDMRTDYVKFKGFKNQILEKVSAIKSLKKFIHCLVKFCDRCNNRSLEGK